MAGELTPVSPRRKLDFSEEEDGTYAVRFDIPSSDRSNFEDDGHDQEEEEPPPVLDPSHPLLAKFQQALKEHLEQQIEHLSGEVAELEAGAKLNNDERERIGIETYEAQQQVNKQQQDLEMCVIELDDICAATEQMENELEEAKNAYSAKRLELLESEKKEVHLRTELEGLNFLLQQMKEWESEVESELTINQRVFEKTNKDKLQLAVEKREQDAFIYTLMSEIFRLEEELENLDMQIRVKEEERENMADIIANGNVELQTIAAEHRCLLYSWNSIVIAISHRDKDYLATQEELSGMHEKLRTMNAELDQTKKFCKKEMNQNERLTDMKCRVQADFDNCRRSLDLENRKRNNLEMQIATTQLLLDQTEQDIKKMLADNANKSNELGGIVKEFERCSQMKLNLDEEIFKSLDEQLTNNKAAKYMNKLVREVKDKNRDNEINLASLENSNAKTLMDIEAQKCINEETQRFLNELIKEQNQVENELKGYANQLEKLRFLAGKKQRDVDVLSTKIESAMNKTGGLEISPQEVKILTLEKNIEVIRENIKELQRFWLRQQGYVVQLSQQRQDQINDINMLKKQMQLLVQKNLKINDELEAYCKQEEKLNRFMNTLQNRLLVLNEGLCKKRDSKDNLDKSNNSLKFEYSGKLQDAELEAIKIDADIIGIEEDKINLSNELIEMNRESLAWERKIQMAVETKKNMDKEKGEGGEVGNMKAEIHRMHVRFGQLRKAQDKLIHDLEHCVSRRDAIITIAVAREKKEKGGSEKTRINFNRKLIDMKNKVQQMENEMAAVQEKIECTKHEEQTLIRDIAIAQQEAAFAKHKIEEMKEKTEEIKTERQKNLELLVLKQKKLKVYSELAKGRHPYVAYRTETSIIAELDKQKEINNKLLNVLDNLTMDFPSHRQELMRILNTLKLPHIYLYK